MNAVEKKRLANLEDALDIQGADGNWNYDPYMHGMYNGLAFAIALMKGEAVEYREPPEKWLSEDVKNSEKCDTFVAKITSFKLYGREILKKRGKI